MTTTIDASEPEQQVAEARPGAWHEQPAETVLEALEAPRHGLGSDEARRRLELHGPNVLPRAKGPGVAALLWRQINNPLIYVLLASALLALLMGKLVDGLVVLGVVVLNTLIGFFQEYRASRAIAALVEFVPETATALRDGHRADLPARDLVPGDVVLLQSGDKVPADLRLFAVRHLQIEEAALTGESVPVTKETGVMGAGAGLGDRRNLAFSGTMITYGTGTGVVVATGQGTELGRISTLLEEATEVETPLTRQIATFGKVLTLGISLVALLLMGVGLWRGYPLVDAVLAAITLAVAAIPEGLPAIITIALAIGVQRMARRNAVIRHLPAVETLGSTTVICTDKTGTLTRGEMTVQALWTPAAGAYEVEGVGYAPEGALRQKGAAPYGLPDDLDALLTAGLLCNDAALEQAESGWRVNGDPTEGALLVVARKAGLCDEATPVAWPRQDAVPFESHRQFMATLHAGEEGRVAFVKGAPEVIARRCVRAEGAPLDEAEVLAEVERLAGEGMRVLAFARIDIADSELSEEAMEGGLTLLGLQGMIDPPRPEAMEAVRLCRRAGIHVKMITGDHQATAGAIGRQLGLLHREDTVVTGAQIEAMDEATLAETARTRTIFARVAPEHKLRLVRCLQRQGQVVAMTGDGVNDAPALKQADIGVAMGQSGTAVSKEAADIVLADDNFASIAAAVEEGRRVYDNLLKSLAFVLPTNMGEALIILLAVLFFPIFGNDPLLPMEPVQILWINLVATVALALPLAFEAMEPNVMRRPPREPAEPLLSRFVLTRTILVALLMTAGGIGLFLYEYHSMLGQGVAALPALRYAQTTAVTTVILFQIFYLLNCRSLRDSALEIGLWSNRWIYVGIFVLLVLQAGFVYLPFMNAVFGSAPLGLEAWAKATLVALVVLPVISVEKRLRQRQFHKQLARHEARRARHEAGKKR